MAAFWALWWASPVKLMIWLSSRAAAWMGVAAASKKLKHTPDRTRRFLFWMLVINAVAWLVWAGALWCLSAWKVGQG